jgi:hypothetical protein
MISEELTAFIESGVSILVGTRDHANRPYGMRGVGVRASADRKSLTVLLPDATGKRALADVRDNGRVAFTFTRPIDHRSIQLKGAVTSVRAATDEERRQAEKYIDDWAGHVEVVGLPRALGSRLACWPSTAVTVRIESVFHQTPGPSAGARVTGNP